MSDSTPQSSDNRLHRQRNWTFVWNKIRIMGLHTKVFIRRIAVALAHAAGGYCRLLWRASRALLVPFLFVAVIGTVLECVPWRFVCEVVSESTCLRFRFQSAGEQEFARIASSINCSKVWVWTPSIELGSDQPVTLKKLHDESWVLFERGKESALSVNEISVLEGTEVVLEMDDHHFTMNFSNSGGAGASAQIQLSEGESSVLATDWLRGTERVLQQEFKQVGGTVNVADLRRLTMIVEENAFNNPLIFEQFFRVQGLRFNENARREWRPVSKGEVRFRQAGDVRIKLERDHVAIPEPASVVISNLTLGQSSIHSEVTGNVASLMVGKAPSYSIEMCPSLLDAILKSKFVALVVLLCGWVIGTCTSSGKILEAINKSKQNST